MEFEEHLEELSCFIKDLEELLKKHKNVSPEFMVAETVERLAYLCMELVPPGINLRDVFLEAVEVGIEKHREEKTND